MTEVVDNGFTVTSGSLRPNEFVPMDYVFDGMGCTGRNISPEIVWSGAPTESKSFAVTCTDPDAPSKDVWWHWTVVNIPNNVNKLEEGASNENKLPQGAVEVTTDFDQIGYGGPCPPQGDTPHRYIFTVYALDTEQLRVNEAEKAEGVKASLEKHCLSKASFTVKFAR